MKKLLVLTCVFLCLTSLVAAEMEEAPPAGSTGEKLAKMFVSLLAQGDFEKATATFDDNMKGAVSPVSLETIWKSLRDTLGDYQKIEATKAETSQQFRIVFVTCQFQKQRVDVKVVIDKADKIAGLFFVPVQVAQYIPPSYVKATLFQDSDVTVGTGEWILPGKVSMPVGKGPFPAVILVHGSGPNDKDESIGVNKPFRDLAWGLASRGVAVLRYEKRTRKYAAKIVDMKELTVRDETIIDALEAVSLLKKTERIDPGKIFVLGHSLGGMLAPRIAVGNTNIAGLVILAGAARPLEDLILEQTLFQVSLSGELTLDNKKKVDEIRCEVEAVKKLSKESSPTCLLLGTPGSYWLDLKGYNPAGVAKTLKQPMLILQGERDCQVRMDDFNEWRKVLSSRTDVMLKSYPTLNHLFMEVQGQSTGAEYQQASNVAELVISDIAEWIKKY